MNWEMGWLRSFGKGPRCEDAVTQSHWVAAGAVSCEWDLFWFGRNIMDLSDCMRDEVGRRGHIVSTILHDLLSLSEVDVKPLVLGLQQVAESKQPSSLWQFQTDQGFVGWPIIVVLLLHNVGSQCCPSWSVLLGLTDAFPQSINCLTHCLSLSHIANLSKHEDFANRLEERRFYNYLHLKEWVISDLPLFQEHLNFLLTLLQSPQQSISSNAFELQFFLLELRSWKRVSHGQAYFTFPQHLDF